MDLMPTPCPAGTVPADYLFDAVLRPNRSLHGRDFRRLMLIVSLVAVGVGTAFLAVGAWPVVGFFGLDVLLVYAAFKASYRTGRVVETVQLTRDRLTVRRIRPDGSPGGEWQFQPAWLQVRLERTGDDSNRLLLSSHGRSISIGAFLAPHERVEIADALRAALAVCRPACR